MAVFDMGHDPTAFSSGGGVGHGSPGPPGADALWGNSILQTYNSPVQSLHLNLHCSEAVETSDQSSRTLLPNGRSQYRSIRYLIGPGESDSGDVRLIEASLLYRVYRIDSI